MARTAGWDDGALRASNDAAVSIVPPKSRVGDWRAGLGRCLCSLFPRPFGCEVSQHRDHATFPVPATSNAACGFPACTLTCLLHLKGYGTYPAGATFGCSHLTL